jgi:hypothetical protein
MVEMVEDEREKWWWRIEGMVVDERMEEEWWRWWKMKKMNS